MKTLEAIIRIELTKRVKQVVKTRPTYFGGEKSVKKIVDKQIQEYAKEIAEHQFPNIPHINLTLTI